MMTMRDGHVRCLPIHVANKIAAGEVVERPASVVKELLENAIDAGAKNIRISITQGGRKLVAVQDDGCGMLKDDAVLSLERQATSKIMDVEDIEQIDTLGFRGEAIPSIASVSRFTLTTRRHEQDEGTMIQVNAGTLAEVRAAGCPPGTLVEVRDLFCNVPARRKFLRAYATEESHVKAIFTVHALAHPTIGFSLVVDGRELHRLAPANNLADRVRDIFGREFLDCLMPLPASETERREVPIVTGYIEKPNLSTPTRREQYIFINGRPATAPSIAYALREAYPRKQGDVRPAAIIFITIDPKQVDVNVHPTKREVRFRDNTAVKNAIIAAISKALSPNLTVVLPPPPRPATDLPHSLPIQTSAPKASVALVAATPASTVSAPTVSIPAAPIAAPTPAPTAVELPLAVDEERAKPWKYFKYLAQSESGYLLIETDAGIVTVNPLAARERIAYEKLLKKNGESGVASQQLLIPDTVRFSPVEASRILQSLPVLMAMGFQLEEFGKDTFKIDAIPQLLGSLSVSAVLHTIANDLGENASRRAGEHWREELIAKSVARSFSGASIKLDEASATRLIEELCLTRMPYICPRGKPVMIFTSTRELDRKFDRV